jgi:polyvinyl alcohol dehydrogenase (cytochrome)
VREGLRSSVLIALAATAVLPSLALGQLAETGASASGATVFERECAACHQRTSSTSQAPSADALRQLVPEVIVTALTSGRMRVQGEMLSEAQRRAVAEYLAGRTLANSSSSGVDDRCASSPRLPDEIRGPEWNGWGVQLTNARYQPASSAGLSPAGVPKLKLKWAFGFAGPAATRAQPTVVAGRLFTASERGDVYALDADSGCLHWVYRAQGAVRTAITVAPYYVAGRSTRYAAYFGDGRANAYAVDAETGTELWVRKIDEHPNASITGGPAVYRGRVYVPTSAAGEEVRGGRLDYGCCTFRGSISALDALTGAVVWKSYSIAEEPKARAINKGGVQLYGPAGGGMWGSPTIDARRGVLYIGTGNGFAEPAQATTNAILAFDLETGRIRWSRQTVANDVWLWQCPAENPDNPNCPAKQGPDFDFGASPLIARTPQGRELLVVPQKSGVLYALDPDKGGATVWEYRFGEGSALGGQWGAAADERNAYIGDGGFLSPTPGGIHAVDLDTGKRVWYTPPGSTLCTGGADARCFAAQGGAITVIPGIVFSGGADGGVRAYSTLDGSLVWQADTNREYATVNGVKASGATIDGPGPVVVGGTVFVNSGYGGIVGRTGNVLLAFDVGSADRTR